LTGRGWFRRGGGGQAAAVPRSADPVGEELPSAGLAEPDSADVKSQVVSGVRVLLARGLTIRLIGLLGSIALARLLSPRDFGLLAIGLTLVTFANFVTDVGMGAQLIRAPDEPARRQLSAVLALQLVIAVIASVVVSVIVLVLDFGPGGDIAAALMWIVVLQTVRGPAVILLERRLQFRRLALAEVLEAFCYVVAAVSLATLGLGVWSVVAATVLRVSVSAAFLLWKVPDARVFPRWDFSILRPLFAFGAQFQLASVVVLIRDQSINVLTAALAGATVLGYWTLAQRVLSLPFLLFESLWRVSFPGMARLLAAGTNPKKDIEKALALGGLVTALAVTGLSAASPLLVPAIFGSQWAAVSVVVPLASLGLILGGPISAAGAGYLYASGHPGIITSAQAAEAVIFIVGLVVLLPGAGVLAHGILWLLAAWCEAVILGLALRKLARVRVLRAVAPPAVLGCAVYALALLVTPVLPVGLLGGLLLAGGSTALLLLSMRILLAEQLSQVLKLLRPSRKSASPSEFGAP